MAGWSSFAFRNIGKATLIKCALGSYKKGLAPKCFNYIPVRSSGHGKSFWVKPTKYTYLKYLDVAHLYFLLGAIPLAALIFYCNVFIGSAKLAAIPEGYEPKPWEYYPHPITRWFVKMKPSPQESYEKELHKIHKKGLLFEIRKLEKKIDEFMKDKEDYQAWYFVDTGAKYTRKAQTQGEYVETTTGRGFGIVS